jgi:phosphopantothenoylcysteine synthetase/decarboxylase
MRILITAGPSCAPIDRVRRLTNFSSGELGSLMGDALTASGHEVVCLMGEMASHLPKGGASVRHFGTNQELLSLLKEESVLGAEVVLHAAALCDYEVVSVADMDGHLLEAGKIATDLGELRMILRPALKVLPALRGLFPRAVLLGWKYEVDGTRAEALAKGRAQIEACGTDGCVVNGPAYGQGLGLLPKDGTLRHWDDKRELAASLAEWLFNPPGA